MCRSLHCRAQTSLCSSWIDLQWLSAREDPQAAGVNGHRLVDSELQREVGYRSGTQHAGVRFGPRRRCGEILLQPAIGLVDSALQHEFHGPRMKFLRPEFGQQCNRVMIQRSPTDGVNVLKQSDHFRAPCPRQVLGQRHALVIEGFRLDRSFSE